MCSVTHLLNVVMDDIKDTKMHLRYAEHEEKNGKKDMAEWYRKQAKARFEKMKSTFKDVESVLKLEEEAKTNEYACAVLCHIQSEMHELAMDVI